MGVCLGAVDIRSAEERQLGAAVRHHLHRRGHSRPRTQGKRSLTVAPFLIYLTTDFYMQLVSYLFINRSVSIYICICATLYGFMIATLIDKQMHLFIDYYLAVYVWFCVCGCVCVSDPVSSVHLLPRDADWRDDGEQVMRISCMSRLTHTHTQSLQLVGIKLDGVISIRLRTQCIVSYCTNAIYKLFVHS